jgi:hypothetical protein
MMHNAHMLLQGFIGFGYHVALVPPPITPPALFPHISASTLAGVLIKAKYSATELGMGGIPLVARGNDSGLILPHISIPPTNTLLPVHIAFGGSKVMFGSSKVKINAGGAQDCGCCVPPCVPISVNLACNNPCNYPSDLVIAPNTVEVGMTPGDIMGGIISTLIDIGISYAVGKAAGGINGATANFIGRRFTEAGSNAFTREFLEASGDGVGRKFSEMLGRAASNGIVQNWMGNTATGQLLDNAVQEWVTKPLVDSVVNAPAGDLSQRGQDLSHLSAGEDLSDGGDPPIYGTDNVDREYVNIDDDWW